MLDTIKFKIPKEKCISVDEAYFKVLKLTGEKGLGSKTLIRSRDYISNEQKTQRKKGVYTLKSSLKIRFDFGKEFRAVIVEVSIPKLLFQNNLDEVTERDKTRFIKKVKEELSKIKVEVSEKTIRESVVMRVDFGKNIILPLNSDLNAIFKTFQSYNFFPVTEFNDYHYRNGTEGRNIKYFNLSNSLTFYDKISEIGKHGFTDNENYIITNYHNKNVLRFEYSMQRIVKVRSEFNKYYKLIDADVKKDITINDVFNKYLVKHVLLDKINQVFAEEIQKLVELSRYSYLDLIKLLDSEIPDYKTRCIVLAGIIRIKEVGEYKEYIKHLKEIFPNSTYHRYKNDIDKYLHKITPKKSKSTELIKYILNDIEEFKPYKYK